MRTAPNKESFVNKDWIIHDFDNGTTAVVKYVTVNNDGNYVIAVGRGVKSVDDNMFSRPEGRKYAFQRMNDFFECYRRKYLKNSQSKRKDLVVTEKIRRNPHSREHVDYPVFAIGGETLLTPHEMEVWHNTILPKIEQELNSNE